MKTRLSTACILIVGLGLVLTWAVTAQGPSPDLFSHSLREIAGLASSAVDAAKGNELAGLRATAAISLGQPGLSFRYVQTFGVTEEPYPADAQHLNGPNGLFIDGSNNLYVIEERGYRLLKYNSSGGNVMTLGHAGLPWSNYLMWPKDVAVAGDGHIWVAMRNCLKEFNATGAEIQLFPNVADPWSEGSDNEHFNDPRGVAFDSAGRMYIADRYNHRVQVYTFTLGSPVYSTTIGVTGVSGNDDAHFNEPHQIVIDGSSQLYVADAGNYRVQRCTYSSGWACTTFHGTGSEGSGDNELSWATGTGIDGSGNVYIADSGNGRVKKCTGGGSCNILVSGLLWPADVAVDTTGNVYVNDDHAIRSTTAAASFSPSSPAPPACLT